MLKCREAVIYEYRRELVDAFMRGDDEGWLEATRAITGILREESAPRREINQWQTPHLCRC